LHWNYSYYILVLVCHSCWKHLWKCTLTQAPAWNSMDAWGDGQQYVWAYILVVTCILQIFILYSSCGLIGMLKTAFEIGPSSLEYRGPLVDSSTICLNINIGRYIEDMHILFQFWFHSWHAWSDRTRFGNVSKPPWISGPLGELSEICLTLNIGRYIKNVHIIFQFWFGMLETALEIHPSPGPRPSWPAWALGGCVSNM